MGLLKKKYAAIGLVWLILWLNPLSVKWLESSMVGYMLVQIPGLIAGGYFIGKLLSFRFPEWGKDFNPGGVPGLLIAIFTIAYWILPRSVDAAINNTIVDVVKCISLPLIAGVPLTRSWRKLNSHVKGFVWANLVAMLFVMGWLYLSAPVRVCNNFLQRQQNLLGEAMLIVGFIIALYFVFQAFVGKENSIFLPDKTD